MCILSNKMSFTSLKNRRKQLTWIRIISYFLFWHIDVCVADHKSISIWKIFQRWNIFKVAPPKNHWLTFSLSKIRIPSSWINLEFDRFYEIRKWYMSNLRLLTENERRCEKEHGRQWLEATNICCHISGL